MRKIISAMRSEKAIIISTHLLEEVEAVCSRAIIIAHGRILGRRPAGAACPALAPSQRRSPRHRRRCHLGYRPELAALPNVAAVEPVSDAEGDGVIVVPRDGRPIRRRNRRSRPRSAAGRSPVCGSSAGGSTIVFREITTARPGPAPISAAA